MYENYGHDKEQTHNFLKGFACPKNTDVEKFLHQKALRFEESNNAKTHLILSDLGEILAYFSLSFKEVDLNIEKMSKSEVKQLDGISKHARHIRVFLIGQIGKNSLIDNNPVNLSDILRHIDKVLLRAQKLIGGRAMILECQPIEKLLHLYERYGFKQLTVIDDGQMKTLYRVL
ncbi:hypothetical protein B0181_06000 [Moraxella caviae]|uniref:Uncharacterized protein n=1 Tax=Moraxella caviae TaxID=34060 RepID=A0A1T0A268_9GAMM|nr:hypothetical protein B0181_06000 [Moraxella caviae]